MKQRVLVVEDEPDLRSLVAYNLTQAGYDIEAVGSGFEALRAVARKVPDLVVLDLMLPDLPGTHICRELKAGASTRRIPVLMLTAKGDESSRVTGLEIGADDYVVKPVSMRELVLRVAAVLRRSGSAAPPTPTPSAPADAKQPLALGDLRLDREAHQVWLAGKVLDLTPIEFRLLALLLERPGRAQSRERLLEDVWEVEDGSTSRTVDTHIKRLRGKLGGAGERIETVRGVGYRFRREE